MLEVCFAPTMLGKRKRECARYRGLAGRAHHNVMRAAPPPTNEALQLYTKAIITRFSSGEFY
jgi:hypothetical protein